MIKVNLDPFAADMGKEPVEHERLGIEVKLRDGSAFTIQDDERGGIMVLGNAVNTIEIIPVSGNAVRIRKGTKI